MMSNRIILCSTSKFPRGGPEANVMHNLSLALLSQGYHVILVCQKNYQEEEYLKNFKLRAGNRFSFIEINYSKCKSIKKIQTKLFSGLFIANKINKIAVKGDVVIMYIHDLITTYPIIRLSIRKKLFCGCHPAEWLPCDLFANKWKYWYYEKGFDVLSKCDFILPMTTFIRDGFFKKGCKKQLILPFMCDPDEYVLKNKKPFGKIKFMYPSNGWIKDSFPEMIKALTMLTNEELSFIEMHLKGVSPLDIQNLIGEEDYDKIKNSLQFHGWLTYDELIDLYQECHYLLLARDTNQMTIANFPSKVIEAMTYGVVPVASIVGDYTSLYLINGVNSILMNGNSPVIIAEAIKNCISLDFKQYQKLSKNAYRMDCDKLSYKIQGKHLSDFLNSLKID